MHRLYFICLALIAVLLTGCSDSIFQVRVGETFELNYGGSAYILDEGLTITFEGQVIDSRCPRGAECIWAGQAEVDIARAVQTTIRQALGSDLSPAVGGRCHQCSR